ncbi:hypothetical protein C8R45DRAFT_1016331 [Mycena sanguinolenta]|nr:hypothetical protein C8R45DRAFT_1016331 [Mycena sanguinolenta]
MFDDGRATWALYCGDLGGFAGDLHCPLCGMISRAASSSSSRFATLPIPASRFPLGPASSQFHPARQLYLSIADHGIVVVPPLSRTSSTSGSASSVSALVTTLPTIDSSGAAPSSASWTGAGSRPGIAVALALGRGSCRDLGVVVVTVESLRMYCICYVCRCML